MAHGSFTSTTDTRRLLAQASYHHTQAYVMMIKTKMASFAFVNEFLAMYNAYFVQQIFI